MKKRRAQISVEYIMMLAVALMILVPALFMFRNYVFESNDQLVARRLNDISSQIFSKARKMYYYGPPSKSVLTTEMPPQIDKMFLFVVPENDKYYLVFKVLASDRPLMLDYESEIPLDMLDSDEIDPGEDIEDICVGDGNRYCKYFPERIYSNGLKNIKIEASDDCDVRITERAYCIKLSDVKEAET